MKTHQRQLHEHISDISGHADVRLRSPLPLGTQERCGGVNFAIFSRHASRVQLELFDHPEDAVPVRVIDLNPFATAISRLPPWDFASARGYDPLAPEQDLALSKLDNSSSMPIGGD